MKFGGLFLFDILEHCGKWEELNYRGYIEVWRHKERLDIVVLEPYENSRDDEDLWELWFGEYETGHCETLYIGPYKEAKKEAFKFMRENP
jgi:hypothetical protein